MLRNLDGAICADAVGLGKTWTTLAVIKFYQLEGRKTIVICLKKLEHNWNQFRENQFSKFEKDHY
ncbi:MAG: SNF2-related protein [Paludibacter sp.]|nr:SNF2-related protein [Paludibacter sp.]